MAVEPAVSTAERETAKATDIHAIAMEGVVRRYGEREALNHVSLRLEPGQTLAVFGPNGAGKTTLLRMLATLLVPHEGDLRVFGHPLPREAYRVRPRVGLLAHEPLLYLDLSAWENLSFYAQLYDLQDAGTRIAHLLEVTGMTARADEPVRNLSRGMAQRIGICRAVLHRPDLLLLDEPTAHLDPEAAAMCEPLIGSGTGVTRVLVTHEIEHGLSEADRVLGLRDGTALIDAPATSLDERAVRGIYGART
jgi:heme exporter protein A